MIDRHFKTVLILESLVYEYVDDLDVAIWLDNDGYFENREVRAGLNGTRISDKLDYVRWRLVEYGLQPVDGRCGSHNILPCKWWTTLDTDDDQGVLSESEREAMGLTW